MSEDETSLEAALRNEMERLREEINLCTGVCGDKWKEIVRLRAALEKIRDTDHSTAIAYRSIAKEALGDE